MKNNDGFEQMVYSLEYKQPILLVGAGFSMEAKNGEGQEYGTGGSLSKMLFEKLCKDGSDVEMLPDENNLKEVCDYIREQGKTPERDRIITEQFTGCTPMPYHDYLLSYPWKFIFSLNDDCLIETLYEMRKKRLEVWVDKKQPDIKQSHQPSTQLIKLHGCVRQKKHNYVFDETEYRNNIIEEDCYLREIAHQLSQNDIILLGTEFQEDDILTIIEIYAKSGYEMNHKFYFVTPSINSKKLQWRIKDNECYYWIKQTTKDFLNYLKTIKTNVDRTEFMRERSMVPITQAWINPFHQSKLYQGAESQFADFWSDWDIRNPELSNWEQSIEHAGKKVICSIIGHAYCGKTCVAKRIAVDLCKKGYITFEYTFSNYLRIEDMLEYIKTFQNDSKIAILCDDNAATYWQHIKTFINEIPSNISKCVVLAVAKKEVFFEKKYEFYDNNTADLLQFLVDENINKKHAQNIINKLDQHNMLSRFSEKCGDNYNAMVKKCLEIKDIIDVLYFSSSGRYYIDHIREAINLKKEEEKKYFFALIELADLNITSVPLSIFVSLLKRVGVIIDLESF